MSQNPTPAPPRPSSRPPILAVALIVLNVLGLGFVAVEYRAMRQELGALREDSDRMKFAVDLLRFESTSHYEGKGFNALLDHLTYWAPHLQNANEGTSEFFKVEKRVEDAVEIMGQLPDVFPTIAATLRSGEVTAEDPATDDEIRKWLLRAAHLADPEQGIKLYADLLRATEIDASGRLRRIAVTELFEFDKQLTGEILHKILTNENARGIGRPGAQTGGGRRGKQPQFYNFIEYYVASKHPAVVTTLMQILSRPEHDLLTQQECVKALGKLKVVAAIERLKSLYWEQHSPQAGRVPNPLFRMKILNAVIEIEGDKAAPFLKKIDRLEGNTAIQNRLTELRKEIAF